MESKSSEKTEISACVQMKSEVSAKIYGQICFRFFVKCFQFLSPFYSTAFSIQEAISLLDDYLRFHWQEILLGDCNTGTER